MVGILQQDFKVSYFLTELKDNIRTDVQAQTSLNKAFSYWGLLGRYDEDCDIQMDIDYVCENATPRISQYAMARDQEPEIMRVWGSFKEKTVVILIDSGSTHDFINAEAT